MNSASTQPITLQRATACIQVFLIDDYQPVLQKFAKLIQSDYPRMDLAGTATSRSEAITGVITHQPDVILLDYGLSNESTLDFLSQLAVLGRHHILILVGDPYPPELGRRAASLGACGIISKEAPAELLLHAIECAHKQGQWSALFTQKNLVIERRHSSRQP